MDTLYWLGEYGKVLCAYVFLMFVWPLVIFGRSLGNKDAAYVFSFCVTVQVVLITAVVLLLGVCHVLHGWIVGCLFYGAFAVSVFLKVGPNRWMQGVRTLKKLMTGTYLLKPFVHDLWRWQCGAVSRLFRKIGARLRSRWLEYTILGVLVVYGATYFSYGAFQNFGYGASDMFVHHQWTDALLDGDIFFAGIYPKGMHCVLYALHVLFGIRLYNCIQLLAGVQIMITLVAAYLFLRSVFRWRYTALFVLALFLTAGVMGAYEAFSVARLQWTLPQEFGMYTEFLSALFLVRYLKSPDAVRRYSASKRPRFAWNRNLFIFTMAIAAATVIHFYCTIIALLLCLPFAVFNIKKLLNLRKFLSLIAAGLVAIGAVALPMVAAYAAGVPLQGSLAWALQVMEGTADTDAEGTDLNAEVGDTLLKEQAGEKISIDARLEHVVDNIYWRGYVEMFQQKGANFLLGMAAITVNLWACYRLIWPLPRRLSRRKESEHDFDSYLPVIVASFLFVVDYVAPYLDLPQIVEKRRIFTIENLLQLAITLMPVDMLFALLAETCRAAVLKIASAAAVTGICLLTIFTGAYHGHLFTQMAQYNAEVMVVHSIIDNFPPNSFTIVSTTSELYQVKQFGRHEEVLRFIREIDAEEYQLPTEYIFVFVEKRPLQYGQFHFFDSPEWLGNDLYYSYYRPEWGRSRGAELNSSVVSPEAAQTDMSDFAGNFDDYVDIHNRTILESKLYLWCQNFRETFPLETSVYYEDDYFVCYCIRQNPESPFNLAIGDWDSTEGIEWNVRAADTGIEEENAVGGLA